ncbi:conserved oligomeric Golgi complex subunit 7-like [Limulus polyphemus]|uniref:Conserved oligomeric Golgi complex subunit 7 n=1 Tax=Limulus polyphemus TaxID=6850 RepID=A0ABM1B943_LIMPO|nr:conserved oligomeric Golgi complex subunit 7-like [Limulus polyphemus]
MDLSAFSNDNFDAKEWINATFRSPEAQKNKEQYATNLVLKLQLMIQKVNSALEDTAQQVLQNLPRVLREVETMRQEAGLLQEQMKTVKEDFIKVERDSTTSMKNLLKIDTVKSRMQEANKALREADNWTTLSSDVEQVFESGAISTIAGKLIGMQNSLEILVDVPDYKERRQQLEELKNRLEALLSPQLVAAFNIQSVEAAQSYVKIFRDIKRLPELQKCYHKCQKEAEDLMDLVQLLGESTNKILILAEEAENRCQLLTRGCSYPDLIEALKDFFAGYTNKVSKMLEQLKLANTQRDRSKYLTDSWMLFQHTLHSLQFIGEFFLQLETFEQALFSHVRETIKKLGYSLTLQEEEEERKCSNPFHSYVDLFLTSPMKNELQELVTTIQSRKAFRETIWRLENPGGTVTLDLPVFSLSPQEYITQIGQYLMTLPQHIEPFALEENPALHTALKHGKLPYTSEHDTVEHVADYLVGCLARGTMEMYVEKILEVSYLTPHAIQQLIIDIEYLTAVVEDLGLSPSENLQDVKTLLKADASGFTAAAQGKQAHLVSCIRSMRGIE